jgi:hypothetical protein
MIMKKEELKSRLEEVKNQIKTNSKDAHFAEKLIDEALSLKGQLSVEPVLLDCGKEEYSVSDENFTITKTNKGMLYHTTGGYSIFATPQCISLHEELLSVLTLLKEEEQGIKADTVEEEENIELLIRAISHVLNIPMIAFGDHAFMYQIATLVVEYINKTYEELMNKELQEETIEEDAAFKEATLAVYNIAKEINAEKENK